MEQSKQDAGTIAALMIRFKESRLPRASRLLDKVNGGDILSDYDIRFLKRVPIPIRKDIGNEFFYFINFSSLIIYIFLH